MNLWINGERRHIEEVTHLSALPAALGLEPKMILIEHNGTALHRSEWATTPLHDGDRIEILQVFAGG
jgi:sulfur carrier protein